MKRYRSKHKKLPMKMRRLELYTLPKWIEEKLTKEVVYDFYMQLVNIYNRQLTYYDDLINIHGTTGWQRAFDTMCEKYGLTDVHEYCKSLTWYDYDDFGYCIDMLPAKYRIAKYY